MTPRRHHLPRIADFDMLVVVVVAAEAVRPLPLPIGSAQVRDIGLPLEVAELSGPTRERDASRRLREVEYDVSECAVVVGRRRPSRC